MPFHFGDVLPEHFQLVEVARLFLKEMHHNRPVVQEYPRAFLVSFYRKSPDALRRERLLNLLGDALQLPTVAAACDDEKVGDVIVPAQVKDAYLSRFLVRGDSRAR